MRIVKEYAERRREIINAAQELFVSKGYNQTSVNDIMEKVGIAKSNFYYYFSSKDELLDALVDLHTEQHLAKWQEIIENPRLDALTKLNKVFSISSNIKKEHRKLNLALLTAAYNDDNIMIRHFLNRRTIELAGKEVAKIVEQGIKEGVFATPYPEQVVKAVFRICENALDDMKDYILGVNEQPENIDIIMEHYRMLEHFTERLLGAKAGTIRFVERDILEEMLLQD